MKDLIIKALDDALILLEKRIPQTKKEIKYVNIDDVYFGGNPNSYDSFDEVCLCYNVDIPTTEKDKLIFCRSAFTSIAWKSVFDLLIKNGYKRISYNSASLKQFDGTSVYEMYINNDYDLLVKYYSLSFVKE